MSKAIVTGAAGFIGSTLAEKLLEQGHEVVGIDAFLPNYCAFQKNDNWNHLHEWDGFTGVVGDLVQLDLDRIVAGTDVIFHQAALPGVRDSWGKSFPAYLHHNVLATQVLLHLAVKYRVKEFVYASSSSVYGQQSTLPLQEKMCPSPFSPYGVTKLAGEHLVRAYHDNYGLATTSLRYFTVYGPRQRRDMAIYRFIDAMAHGREVKVYGDGNQTRDFTFVEDVVRANIAAWQALADGGSGRRTNGEVFNVGSGTSVSVRELLERLGQVIGCSPTITRTPAAAGDVRATLADVESIKTALGWQATTPLQEGLAAQYRWYQQTRPLP
ncbi:MAG: NAD-dependent epimerase/dehydratase family protein [Limnochordaceae bacterium]|nr:NAD-dependent epimerase/dehydratase family protein [Limnochordaceae bacterium]